MMLFAREKRDFTPGVLCILWGSMLLWLLFAAHYASAAESSALSLPGIIFGRARIDNLLVVDSIKDFLVLLIDFLLLIGILAASFLIVYAGVRMLLALGNVAQLATAKSILIWAIIGLAIMLLAKAFILVVVEFSGVSGAGGGPPIVGSCGSIACGDCADTASCIAAGCEWDAGTCVEPIIAGAAPMLFVDMTVNGDGAESGIAAFAVPFEGFYAEPQIASSEYIAKLFDANGQVLFAHAFNSPNTAIGEILDADGNIAQTSNQTLSSANIGIAIPAIAGTQTLEITDALGTVLNSQSVAEAIEVSHRRYAARHDRPYTASLMRSSPLIGRRFEIGFWQLIHSVVLPDPLT